MGLEQYFSQHRTQLWLFKHGIVLAASMVITLGTQAITAGIFKTEYAVLVMTGLNMLNDKLKLLDPEKYWPGVGANAPRKKR